MRIGLQHSLLLFLIAFVWALLFNELNLDFIKRTNPENVKGNTTSLTDGASIWSVDNGWYIPYAENLLHGNGYSRDLSEPSMLVRRTPVYPLFFAAHVLMFGDSGAYRYIRYTQLLLFALAACAMAQAVSLWSGQRGWGLLAGYLFALNPMHFSYSYFTLTEGISVSITVFVFYALVRAVVGRVNYGFIILTGLVIALSFLNRPLTGILLPGAGLFILCSSSMAWNQRFRSAFLLSISFILFISPWVLRNHSVTGDWVIAERYDHGAPMDYGRGHVALRLLTSTWINPAMYSTEEFSSALKRNIADNKTSLNEELITEFIEGYPPTAFQGYNRDELESGLWTLESCYRDQQRILDLNPDAGRDELLTLECHAQVEMYFNDLISRHKKAAPFSYYVMVPGQNVIAVVFNSVTHNIVMLNPQRGVRSWWQSAIKVSIYLLNVLLYSSVLLFILFGPRHYLNMKAFMLTCIPVTLLMLIVGLYRYMEIRYMLPFMPLGSVALAYFTIWITDRTAIFTAFGKTDDSA